MSALRSATSGVFVSKESFQGAVGPREAAKYIGVEPKTLANWRALGRGPAYVCISSRKVVYRLQDLEDYLLERRVGGAR